MRYVVAFGLGGWALLSACGSNSGSTLGAGGGGASLASAGGGGAAGPTATLGGSGGATNLGATTGGGGSTSSTPLKITPATDVHSGSSESAARADGGAEAGDADDASIEREASIADVNPVDGGGPESSSTLSGDMGTDRDPASGDEVAIVQCSGNTAKARYTGLDMFIMQDVSHSMSDKTAAGQTKATMVTQAITTFAHDADSADINAGIAFFGIHRAGGTVAKVCPSGGTASDELGGTGRQSCDPADYAEPIVSIAPLGTNADAISSAVASHTQDPNVTDSSGTPIGLGGSTPTLPAMQGALGYAAWWAGEHPDRNTIVVLATDGLPNVCCSSAQNVAALAAAYSTGGASTPAIKTYVIGVYAENVAEDVNSIPQLNQMAEGGNTGSAFLINTQGTDPSAKFSSAMRAIRDANRIPCRFSIEAAANGQTIDANRAEVTVSVEATTTSLPWVASDAECSASGGWHYDSNATPTVIQLCQASCDLVRADPTAEIDVRLGCFTSPSSGAGGTDSGHSEGAGGGDDPGNSSCLLEFQSCSSTSMPCCQAGENGLTYDLECLSGICQHPEVY